ncbi:MAG TPA: hypothetical protein DEO59_00765 [Balneola sp.]|jgi:hypothetical protein|nr:hypothetical protein [Balneola sp.]MAO76997.1 hypothetical protein [Balneola sp.]MBF64564.1 hypothetical protein [Balneola sp.]MBF65816.1 hypothetical protein [Balneola sp.]HBZ37047.1 hypothetical protein [Balneola sp.]|tara:strand:+ start:6092 stop:6754 length:663 start_codon:yes stop_codon:yes gene_type:complete
MKKLAVIFSFFLFTTSSFAQTTGEFEIARAKYRGGGDWYNDPSALSNLISFAKAQFSIAIKTEYKDVSIGSSDLHSYPFIFLTGHGNININSSEANNLRTYLDNGGFLYIDDDYGIDEHARNMMKQVYPDEEFIELPYSHPIYNNVFNFENGLPKIHEHDNQSPRGFGLFRNGKMVVFYTFESNLADGWADAEIHNNPASVRQQALRMGTNILVYALTTL